MSRSALVVLTALFVTGAVAAPVIALPSTSAQTANDTVTMLTVGGPSADSRPVQSLDASRALGLQRERAESRLTAYTFEARLESAGNGSAARGVIADELASVDDQIADLREEKRSLRQDFVDGEIDAAAYLYGLARIDARAEQLHQRLATLREHGTEHGFDTEAVGNVEGELAGFRGPVSDRLRTAITGSERAIRVDVWASSNGSALSMIEGGTHVRQAYRVDHRTTNIWGTIPPGQLFGSFTNELVAEVYGLEPLGTVVWEGIDRGPGATRGRGIGRGIYVALIETPHLTITAHIDGDTREIFSEVQERRLDSLPPRDAVTAVDNGTRLVVNRTYAGGPLRIATYDNGSGLPTSTTVDVDGERLDTGPDGEVWTLAPHGFRFPVTAMGADGNVSVTVRTVRTQSVSDAS